MKREAQAADFTRVHWGHLRDAPLSENVSQLAEGIAEHRSDGADLLGFAESPEAGEQVANGVIIGAPHTILCVPAFDTGGARMATVGAPALLALRLRRKQGVPLLEATR